MVAASYGGRWGIESSWKQHIEPQLHIWLQKHRIWWGVTPEKSFTESERQEKTGVLNELNKEMVDGNILEEEIVQVDIICEWIEQAIFEVSHVLDDATHTNNQWHMQGDFLGARKPHRPTTPLLTWTWRWHIYSEIVIT